MTDEDKLRLARWALGALMGLNTAAGVFGWREGRMFACWVAAVLVAVCLVAFIRVTVTLWRIEDDKYLDVE